MGYIKCPKCEINYMLDTEELCSVCKQEEAIDNDNIITVPSPIRKNGRSIFLVFQGSTYYEEFVGGFIIAPKQDKGGRTPHHWLRLNNVKKGDVILHCNAGLITAISEAQSSSYEVMNGDEESLQVDCKYYNLKYPLKKYLYKDDIIKYCGDKQFQPFNKNGDGNQGYLFDIDLTLAQIFLKAIVYRNEYLSNLDFIKDFISD